MEQTFITAVFLPLALAVIMLGMGMTLTLDDFRRVVRFPKAAAIGLGNQLILLPGIAFALACVLPVSSEVAMGLMILAVCPGGPTSNLISYLCRADVALSISLTALSSLITVISIPLLINFSLHFFIAIDGPETLPILDSSVKILVITLVPVALGMLLNWRCPAACRRLEGTTNVLSILIFAAVLAGAIVSQKDELFDFFRQAGVAALALNILTMTTGYFSAKWLGLDRKQGLTISVESGLQNGTLAIAIAASPLLLDAPALAITPAIYSLIMFLSAGVLIATTRYRRSSRA